jgi:predicted secreted protein
MAPEEARREQVLEELSEAAVRRFGSERAAALHAALAALAGDIAKIGLFPLGIDDRPAFFVHEHSPRDGADDASV